MSRYAIHIDTFTSLDGLTTKNRRDPDVVLAALRTVKRISCWDMETGNLWRTIGVLEKRGAVVLDNTVAYPWIGVRVVNPVVAEVTG